MLQLQLSPEAFELDEIYRNEGISKPDNNSVRYAISILNEAVKIGFFTPMAYMPAL